MSKILPKSLHTITVLVNVARHLHLSGAVSRERSVAEALRVLRLDDKDDEYGLYDKALAALLRESQPLSDLTGDNAQV